MLDKNDVDRIAKIVKSETQAAVSKELSPIKQDIKKIRQDQNRIIKFFDEAYLELRERVEKLEKAIGISTLH